MTNKDLIKLAGSEEALYYLDEIRNLVNNMCHKTEYEQRRAKQRMKDAADLIKAILRGEGSDLE